MNDMRNFYGKRNIFFTSGSPAGIMNWYPSKMELKQEQAVSSVGSLVNTFRVELKEIEETSWSETICIKKKVEASFRLFDKYIPKFGLLQNLFKVIRKELYDGVYSKQLSTANSSTDDIQRILYFILCERTLLKCDEKMEKMREDLKEQHDIIQEIKSDKAKEEQNIETLSFLLQTKKMIY